MIARALVTLCFAAATLLAQERVALLPFADFNSDHSARDVVMQFCEKVLAKRGFLLADQDSVAAALRNHKIRNTALPTQQNLRSLAEDLLTPYVITGTIHRFQTGQDFSEAAVSARIIRAENGELVWCNFVTVAGGGEASLFSPPACGKPERLAKKITRKLLKSASLVAKSVNSVSEIRNVRANGQGTLPCARVAVIPPINETMSEYVGELFGDMLVSEMNHRGFIVVDPGIVRSVMLQADDLRYGQTVEALSRTLADSLNIDLLVTGSVSELTDSRDAALGSVPNAAAELRLINPNQNTVVWSRAFEKSGSQNLGLFRSGITRSPATLAGKLVRNAVGELRVVRSRTVSPQTNKQS